jgi:hypothetical protein
MTCKERSRCYAACGDSREFLCEEQLPGYTKRFIILHSNPPQKALSVRTCQRYEVNLQHLRDRFCSADVRLLCFESCTHALQIQADPRMGRSHSNIPIGKTKCYVSTNVRSQKPLECALRRSWSNCPRKRGERPGDDHEPFFLVLVSWPRTSMKGLPNSSKTNDILQGLIGAVVAVTEGQSNSQALVPASGLH